MIINSARHPKYSLYYIGAKIIEIASQEQNIDNIYNYINVNYFDQKLSIEYFYLAMDWLFIIGKAKITDGEIELCI